MRALAHIVGQGGPERRVRDGIGRRGTDSPGLDVTKPNIARVYDAFLGGKDNFAADREVVRFALQVTGRRGRRANRAFLRRVVRYLTAEAGIRQLVDIGPACPRRATCTRSRTRTPRRPGSSTWTATARPHARLALLANGPGTIFLTADLRDPEPYSAARGCPSSSTSRPSECCCSRSCTTSTTMRIRRGSSPGSATLAPGSYLAISSFRMPGPEHPEDAAKTAAMEKLFNEKLGTGRWRDHDEILAWFGDWEVLEPGLVPLPEWRPAVRGSTRRNATYYGFVGGVARKP